MLWIMFSPICGHKNKIELSINKSKTIINYIVHCHPGQKHTEVHQCLKQ